MADLKDADGQPRLSKKQKEKGAVWARPLRIFGRYPPSIPQLHSA